MNPRYGGRPNRDRVMVSFYLGRDGKTQLADRATAQGWTQADMLRTLLSLGMAAWDAGARTPQQVARKPRSPRT